MGAMLPMAVARQQQASKAAVLARLLREPLAPPPGVDWDAERRHAAAEKRPGTHFVYRREQRIPVALHPLADGVRCGETINVPADSLAWDEWQRALDVSYRVCNRARDLWTQDLDSGHLQTPGTYLN